MVEIQATAALDLPEQVHDHPQSPDRVAEWIQRWGTEAIQVRRAGPAPGTAQRPRLSRSTPTTVAPSGLGPLTGARRPA